MKSIAILEFGGVDKLTQVELAKPQPLPTELLIEIHYTAVNPVDWKIREGMLKDRLPHKFPLVLGWDAAGVVAAIGKNVKGFQIGDKVYAYCRKPTVQWGTYAEYIAVEAENVAKMPKNISFAQAAALPLVSLTAWQSLFDTVKLQKGETILIHAGAGGVGSMAIQFAKQIGAHVITTASAQKHDYVKKLGADVVIDYTKGFVEEVKKAHPKGIDVVFDCAGGKTLQDSYQLLKPAGRLVSIVEQPDPALQAKHNVKGFYHFVAPNGKELTEIANLIDKNKIALPHIQEMSLWDASKAHELSQSHHLKGKIVLKVK